MSKNMQLLLAGALLLATAGQLNAAENRLQCWHCSSDTKGAEDFCGIRFKENNIPLDYIKERNISVYRTCNSTINSDHERAVCRKTVEEINGKTITKRFCYYANKSDALDYCQQDATEKNVRRIFCQDCLTTKCNSGSKVTMHLVILLLALSAKVYLI